MGAQGIGELGPRGGDASCTARLVQEGGGISGRVRGGTRLRCSDIGTASPRARRGVRTEPRTLSQRGVLPNPVADGGGPCAYTLLLQLAPELSGVMTTLLPADRTLETGKALADY